VGQDFPLNSKDSAGSCREHPGDDPLTRQKGHQAEDSREDRHEARGAETSAAANQATCRSRPMIALARRNDGKGLSFVERLGERRHAQFKHAGPVCYRCKMHASQLASAAQTATA
jgi:hypothetical protein